MSTIFDKWECPVCTNELGWLVISCVYCDVKGIHVTNPDINNRINRSEETMTPQEELFKLLFNSEKGLVKDMDALTLRAHREELAKIAFEARARLSAVDDEEKQRKPKTTDKGFQRSVNGTDDITSDAINTIKSRKDRLTKQERLIEGMMKLPGMDRKTAESLVSAGTIKNRLDNIKSDVKIPEVIKITNEEVKPVFNPFEKLK